MLSSAKALKELDVSDCFNLSDRGLGTMLEGGGGRRLVKLGVRLCNKLSVAFFALLSRSCPDLTVLLLGGIADSDTTNAIALEIRALHPDCKISF